MNNKTNKGFTWYHCEVASLLTVDEHDTMQEVRLDQDTPIEKLRVEAMAGWAARISSLETTQAVAFAMAKHARLGADSPAAVLTQDDCRLIFKLIREEHAALIQVKRLIDIEVWTSERIDRIELHYYGGIDSREAVGAGPRTDGWRRPVSFAPGDYLTGISVTCFPSAYGNDVDDRKLKAELLDGDGLHRVPQFCSITFDTYSGRQYDMYGPPTYRGSYGTRKFKLGFPAGHEILDFKCQTGPDGYITHIGVGSSRVPTWNSDMGRLLLETAPGHLAGHKWY